jgi:hypothetical protein
MSRRSTGWVLTAAVIAALPAPALSSNDPINNLGQDARPAIAAVGSLQPSREGIRPLAGDDGDFTNCLEMTPPQQPRGGLSGTAAGKGPPVDIYVREHSTADIAGEIARAKRGAADQAMPEPLLIDRNLPPNGTARPDQIKAACGIPRGLTLFAPAAAGRGRDARVAG